MKRSIFTTTLFAAILFFTGMPSSQAQYYNQPTKKENTAEVLGAIFGLITVVAVADEVDKGNMTLDEAGEFFENLSDLAETLDAATKNQKTMAKPQAQPSPTPQAERRYNTEPLQTYNLLNYYNTLQSINYYDALGSEWYAKSFRQ
ncbi:MAG: hypothetical protein KDD27_25810 [Saprospiraceae bacterium]|nr:hypothetical protein [Saprospiraceae bacterium]